MTKSVSLVQKKVNNKNTKLVVPKVNVLFKKINAKSIRIEKINYDYKKFQTILYHRKQTNLLDFANMYKQKIQIKTLKYNDTKKLYAMEVTIEY